MDLRDYLGVLRRGRLLIVVLTLLGLGAGLGLALATHKEYRATVQIFVAAESAAGNAGQLAQGNTFIEDRVQSYTSIATAPAVTAAVIRDLHLELTDQELAKKISASAPPNKVLINLFVTDRNPQVASVLANTVAVAFSRAVERTEQTDAHGNSVVKLTVIHPATVPRSPVKPDLALYVGFGVVVGLLLGVAIAIIREMLDYTVKDATDFEALGVPVLGVIPLDKRTSRAPLALRAGGDGARAEAYRLLRTNLQFVNVDNSPRVIAITSAVVGEGKSTTAINLAWALAEAGHQVCLVEADLRRPTIATMLGLVPEIGLTSVLIGKVSLNNALQAAGPNLKVLTSGSIPPNPSELLISRHARDVIQQVSRMADYTVVDTTPLVPVADAAEVATLADATLVVFRSGKTSWDQVAQALSALDKVGRPPVGVVLNMVDKWSGYANYRYGYSSYSPSQTDSPDESTLGDARPSTWRLRRSASARPSPRPPDGAGPATTRPAAAEPVDGKSSAP